LNGLWFMRPRLEGTLVGFEAKIMEIYTHIYNDLRVATGDVLCTHDGDENSPFGRIWRYMGLLLPGEIDHTIVYVGSGGRCVESGGRGVIAFEMPGEVWEARALYSQRWLADSLVGVAYPLEGFVCHPVRKNVFAWVWRNTACGRLRLPGHTIRIFSMHSARGLSTAAS
jgi:hypothetical protein